MNEDYKLNDNYMIELLRDAINLYEDREYTEAKENAMEFVSRLTVERRIVSGTDDELFSSGLPFLATQSERSDRLCAA